MTRRPLALAAALSLLASVGVMVLWIRSDAGRIGTTLHWRGSGYAIFLDRGAAGIDNSPRLADYNLALARSREKEMQRQRKLMEFLSSRFVEGSPPTLQENRHWTTAAVPSNPPPAIRHAVPLWLIAMVLLIFPAIWAASYRRSLLRLSQGRCVVCNYDLAGNTRGVCPECGTAVRRKTVIPG